MRDGNYAVSTFRRKSGRSILVGVSRVCSICLPVGWLRLGKNNWLDQLVGLDDWGLVAVGSVWMVLSGTIRLD